MGLLDAPAKSYDDYFITGGATRSALNDNLLVASGANALDTMAGGGQASPHSYYLQITGSAGISAGAITIEGSNDNFSFTAIGWVDATTVVTTAGMSIAAVTIAASTARFFQGPITYRYLRVRISTAFVGGTVQAWIRLSSAPYASGIYGVRNSSVLSLLAGAVLTPQTSGGHSFYTGSITTTPTAVKASAGQVYGYDFHNPNAAISYVQFFNTASGSVTLGTTTPVLSVGIPANARASLEIPHGLAFSTAITVAVTTTRTGSTAPGSSVDLNIAYT